MRWYLTLLSTCGVRAPKEPLFCDRQNIAKALLDVPVNQPKNLYSSTAKLKEGVTEYMTPDRLCKSVIPRWMTLPSGKKRDKAKAEFAKYKDRILQESGIHPDKYNQYTLISTPRRWGKTTSVAIFVASALFSVPEIWISVNIYIYIL